MKEQLEYLKKELLQKVNAYQKEADKAKPQHKEEFASAARAFGWCYNEVVSILETSKKPD